MVAHPGGCEACQACIPEAEESHALKELPAARQEAGDGAKEQPEDALAGAVEHPDGTCRGAGWRRGESANHKGRCGSALALRNTTANG